MTSKSITRVSSSRRLLRWCTLRAATFLPISFSDRRGERRHFADRRWGPPRTAWSAKGGLDASTDRAVNGVGGSNFKRQLPRIWCTSLAAADPGMPSLRLEPRITERRSSRPSRPSRPRLRCFISMLWSCALPDDVRHCYSSLSTAGLSVDKIKGRWLVCRSLATNRAATIVRGRPFVPACFSSGCHFWPSASETEAEMQFLMDGLRRSTRPSSSGGLPMSDNSLSDHESGDPVGCAGGGRSGRTL